MIFYSVKKKNRTEYTIMMNPSTFVSKIASRYELSHNNSCPVVSYCLTSMWKTVMWGSSSYCRLLSFELCCVLAEGLTEPDEGVLGAHWRSRSPPTYQMPEKK